MSSTAANQVYDLVSLAKTFAPDGSISPVAELLNQSNEQVQDIVWMQGNLPTGHRITQRTGLPTTYTRQLNQPVQVSRSQTAQIEEGMCIFEEWAEYDNDLITIQNNKEAFLYQQSMPFMESMTEKFSQSFIYGDPSVDNSQFLGLAPRYSTVNKSNAANAQNVIDGGGTSNVNTSIWLVCHAPYALHGFFPKGSSAGITHNVFPDAVIQGTTGIGGTRLLGHQERWQWKAGLALWDWRWVVRGCNIDTNNLKTQQGATDLTEMMIDMMYRLPSISIPASTTGNPMSSIALPGKLVFYCNRTVRVALEKQMLQKTNNTLTEGTWDGHKVMFFKGIPIRNCDQILNNEAQIT